MDQVEMNAAVPGRTSPASPSPPGRREVGPGAGGEGFCGGSCFGGGGGGVLVDGQGPVGYSSFQGQGYGGGASGSSTYPDGLPGVILMEIN